jgi:hypothetical protein
MSIRHKFYHVHVCKLHGTFSRFLCLSNAEPEFIDPFFAKTSPKRWFFSVIEIERFGLVFAKTGSINSGTGG